MLSKSIRPTNPEFWVVSSLVRVCFSLTELDTFLVEVRGRVANCTLWFLKPPHIEAKEELIYSVKILGGSSSVLELLETIGNSVPVYLQQCQIQINVLK